MSKFKSLNDEAWSLLFDKYDILNQIDIHGEFQISASQIKEFREPRLMVKFDHIINLPKLFANNNLSILPITRGDYVISHFNAYHKFEPLNNEVIRVSLPTYLESLDFNYITSETFALNCAIATGIIEDFTNDEQIFPTVSGRMSSGVFDFQISDIHKCLNRNVSVINSQIEIDAAYEGLKYLSIFEAKRDLSEDFLVRQLYYPYRTWRARIEKEIKPIFLIYSNGIYHLYEYKFENPVDYNSLMLVKQKNYTIEDTSITSDDIQDILNTGVYVNEPNISFPQADNFERVINLCELLNLQSLSKNEITEKYAFDSRQSDYYINAARYLGLVDKNKDKYKTQNNSKAIYTLSKLGENILKKSYRQRQLTFCRLILQHKVFSDVLNKYFSTGIMPSKFEITRFMKHSNLYNVESDSTFKRRASTIRSWIEWIVELINE